MNTTMKATRGGTVKRKCMFEHISIDYLCWPGEIHKYINSNFYFRFRLTVVRFLDSQCSRVQNMKL